ncbi:TIGR01841 family phasin [Massilia sp.]|uniref:TIGR01841 family phasin n=1 Tax=Massilia sp. TaxID=1882437 RepID=UPI0028B264F9|nr:TIGR01841 family phasin [Massilia sp.]
MFTSPEQFANATKTLFDLQMQTFEALTSKTVKGLEQVVALNMATARNTMDQTLAASRDLTQARDARAAFDALSARMTPDASDSAEYRAQLKTIIDDMQSEFRRAADVHVAEAKSTLSALIYDVTQNVKPGSENAVEIIKAAIDNAFKGYEQVTQATRQAVQTVEAQIAKASSLVNPGMDKAAPTAGKQPE